jgi:nucleoside-diphosphate-sugar epimerase
VSGGVARTPKLLVTGTESGLGAAVHRALGGAPFTRASRLADVEAAAPYDAIIHCAFGSQKLVTPATAYAYLDDNLLLTERLIAIPHRKFVFISSIDIYPLPRQGAKEDDDDDLARLSGPYPFVKQFGDALVRARCPNHLILRPTSLLGPAMRPSTTLRVLTEKNPRVFLQPDSRFNFVLHDDIAAFIARALAESIAGVFNLASTGSVRLGDMAERLGLSVAFGDHVYDAGEVSNAKIAAIEPAFRRTSAETLNRFIDQLGDRFVGKGRMQSRPSS